MSCKLVIISAPSGAGKSTIINRILPRIDNLSFSISATSRPPRGEEIDGKQYYFLSVEEFKKEITNNAFIEYEEVYPNHFYGSLKKEVERLWLDNKSVIFDIDVVGGLNLKAQYGSKAIAIFIEPPSLKILEQRLKGRGTDSEEKIETRLQKAEIELNRANEFDYKIINDNIEISSNTILELIDTFLNN